MRRLPVYFLLDTSGSMFGEPIEALNNALSGMINTLRSDAQASETLWISIITFDKEVKEIMPLTDLQSFQLPEITCPQSGPTFTGKALDFLYDKVTKDIKKSTSEQKGDWKPLLFLFTDGKPSDVQQYKEAIPKIKSVNFGAIVGCAAGHKADDDKLKELTDTVVHLQTADSNTLKQFFMWVSDTIEQGNKSMGVTEMVTLPPPPSEDIIVI
ncbi:VWA domain-containing protein [Tenacibaculum finnmarkense]|uniref:vWA domain-containing protein n=1 Tax=Tenacibaculum finnmarkense TaxID=2781243 RepID=UPI00187B6736|nr:VWA domain-containing protein [Tenacibaculum finnmarkense]MBE7648258.1 VWA domain-containing protein [Tenacibaculum finnmarkense genomovar ulcerans]MCD8422884.1 VWA domain-containing protein [Tenacibaculum finnmarkense genomovar ulcerans]MCG8238889.1 VWA domain-containing protein [Tenacibaculum finnmarkense genomovar ulcerans]